jgi:hypothetical protein
MVEPISITALFGYTKGFSDISIKIAQTLKIVDSIESRLELLIQVELNAALKTLRQALNSSSQQQILLINDARDGFTKATCIEKQERLFYAYLGLGICHYLLEDVNNLKMAFIELGRISISEDFYIKKLDSYQGFNKYSLAMLISSFNLAKALPLIRSLPEIWSYRKNIKTFKNNGKYKNDLSIDDLLRKVEIEENKFLSIKQFDNTEIIIKSLELINIQKQCLEIASRL